MLFIVPTPIGNRKDVSLRALEVLSRVDVVVCEDTRVTGGLLSFYNIKKKLVSFTEQNEERESTRILSLLREGKDVALVSDAGTPLLHDPGYGLVRSCIDEGIPFDSLPGSSAVITALTLSGFPLYPFLFVGYLPKKSGKRTKVLARVRDMSLPVTFVSFESPHRLVSALEDVLAVFGDIEIAVCREMTKLHQEIRRERVSVSLTHFREVKPKGEITLVSMIK